MAPRARRRRRPWLFGLLGGVILAVLLVAGGGLGFVAGDRPGPTPRPLPTLRPTQGPLGAVDSPLISFRLPAGWLEQQQSDTDVKLDHFPNGFMDINVQSTAAVGASTPQALLQAAQKKIADASTTVGAVTTCVPPRSLVIGGRTGLEQGFRWRERGFDGTTLFTNCQVDWASVENGKVYYWSAFNTLGRLRPTIAAARFMQRSALWRE